MAGAAAVAQQGITVQSFPAGTVFSVRLNPLRDGATSDPASARSQMPEGKVPGARQLRFGRRRGNSAARLSK
jgi:hypothetical protein